MLVGRSGARLCQQRQNDPKRNPANRVPYFRHNGRLRGTSLFGALCVWAYTVWVLMCGVAVVIMIFPCKVVHVSAHRIGPAGMSLCRYAQKRQAKEQHKQFSHKTTLFQIFICFGAKRMRGFDMLNGKGR